MQIRQSIGMRFLAMVMALVLCVGAVPAASADGSLSLASEAAVLIDADSGQILYEKNCHQRMYPASITKVMTALLVLQELEPEQVLTVSKSALDAVPITSSHISLKVGEQMTVEQAMYAIGMESANDAANVLAEAVSGSLTAFGERMTQKAKELGALDTHFTNANGLPDSQHYTTAYDMALITAAALQQPGFTEYFSTVNYLFPSTNLSDARVFANKDRMLPGGQYAYDGVLMAKTGWTTSAQGTFAAAAKRGNTTLIAITLKSPLLEDKYRDTTKLFNYGFTHYARISITGEEMAQKLPLGDYVPVETQRMECLLPADVDPSQLTYVLSGDLQSMEGERSAVTVTAYFGQTPVGTMSLVLEPPFVQAETEQEEENFVEEILAEGSYVSPILIAAGAALLVYLFIRFRSWRRRRIRRHHLAARIRMMKKQME